MFRNCGVRPTPAASSAATSTSNPVTRSGCEGSASTKGAPPSGSPAQRRIRDGSAAAISRERPLSAGATKTSRATRISVRRARNTGVDSTRRLAMATVAFLGTGMLGGAMVEGLLRRVDARTVWQLTEAKARALQSFGATVAATPGEAVAGADRVDMTLPDDEVV